MTGRLRKRRNRYHISARPSRRGVSLGAGALTQQVSIRRRHYRHPTVGHPPPGVRCARAPRRRCCRSPALAAPAVGTVVMRSSLVRWREAERPTPVQRHSRSGCAVCRATCGQPLQMLADGLTPSGPTSRICGAAPSASAERRAGQSNSTASTLSWNGCHVEGVCEQGLPRGRRV